MSNRAASAASEWVMARYPSPSDPPVPDLHHPAGEPVLERLALEESFELERSVEKVAIEGVRRVPGDVGREEDIGQGAQRAVLLKRLWVEDVQTRDQLARPEPPEERRLIHD